MSRISVFFRTFVFLTCILILASVLEWLSHRYVMHGLGVIGSVFKNFGTSDSHIEHHSETLLTQDIPDSFKASGLVFNPVLEPLILIIIFLSGIFLLRKATGLKEYTPWFLVVLFGIALSLLYFWVWNSIHASFHKRYIAINEPLAHSETIYGIFPHFVPNESALYYKLLFKYHILHHLNKGKSKGNFNVLLPFSDFIFGTYTPRVDNTLHFKEHEPRNEQERWLKEHMVFDIYVGDRNDILYKDFDKDGQWRKFPIGI